MEFIVAEHAGFCFGVKNAIQKGEALIVEGKGPIATLGSLIHNPQEVKRLKQMGITAKDDFAEMDESSLLIRTHGVSPEVFDQAVAQGFTVYDCTCPFVKKVQLLAESHSKNGYTILILGDRMHPEVQGILGWSGGAGVAFLDIAELDATRLAQQKICLVAQTTENHDKFERVAAWVKSLNPEHIVFNTICSATQERQKDALILAGKVDLMIVVGGFNSANTCKLVDICTQTGTPTHHVEHAAQIAPEWFRGVTKVGITAGASTPDWIIREVMEKMEELTMEQGLEQGYGTLRPLNLHDVVDGVVVKINNDEVLVDVGGKSEGVIPIKELSFQKDPDVDEIVKVGEAIKVMVIKMENSDGHMVLSKKRVDQELAMERLQKIFDAGEIIEAKVVSDVKGGVIVDIGARGFVPASHLDTKYIEDIKSFVGNTYQFKIIEFNANPEERKLILSRRVLLEEAEKAMREELWAEISDGQVRKGIVQRLANFGAFIDLGGVDGLLHISEMGWGRVKQPSDVVAVGDEIEVFILNADQEKGKISLSLKQIMKNPWEVAAEKFPAGTTTKGQVVRIAPFGAFISLDDGVDGLVHISQISWAHVEKVEDALSVGQDVDVKVLEVDPEKKRISLSIKELLERPVVEKPVVEKPAREREAKKDDIPVVHENISSNFGDILKEALSEKTESEEE